MFSQNDLIPEIVKLHKFAMRLTRNRADADDLVQSTCLRALEKSDYFENGTNLFSWTSKIMYNLFVSGYRRRKGTETQYDPTPYLEKQFVKPDQDSLMEFSDVRRAISQLSKNYQKVLFLSCIEGRGYQEVSDILKIPLGTVRSRLSRARAQLQHDMSKPSAKIVQTNMPSIPAYMTDQRS